VGSIMTVPPWRGETRSVRDAPTVANPKK
jgi:hypothetical protein